jgi:DNA processing protein
MTTGPDDERRARASLSRLGEPADPTLGELVAGWGACAVLDGVRDGYLGPRKEHTTLLASMLTRLPTLDVDRDLAALDTVGGRLVCPDDDEWPAPVDDLGPLAPLVLWVRGSGHLATVVDRAVAMVGTRNATEYGELVATDMAATLAEQGWGIVSGGAFGIDAASHRGAMAVGGMTVAVLACGVDVPYPRSHHGLFANILECGVLVSELPPGCAPHRQRFLTRNRLIAALAAGTVVVEAAVRSGAKRTATYTRHLGRPLMVVPGPVTSALSVGCHQLLRDHPESVLVTSAAEVVDTVGRIGDDLAPLVRDEVLPRDELSAETARVLEAVPVVRGQGPARIAATAGLPLATVEGALGMLLLEGFVEERAGGWRLAAGPRDAALALGRTGDTPADTRESDTAFGAPVLDP